MAWARHQAGWFLDWTPMNSCNTAFCGEPPGQTLEYNVPVELVDPHYKGQTTFCLDLLNLPTPFYQGETG